MTPGDGTEILRTRTRFVITAYLFTTAMLLAVFRDRASHGELLATHLVLILLISGWSRLPTQLPGVLRFIRDWYPVMLLPLLFKEVEVLAASFGNWGLTGVLQNLEVSWFGGYPSLYLSEHLPWVPLSEYLHFCYFAYLLLVPGVGGYWYATGERNKFYELVFLVSVTLTISYLFFALFPVDSPFYLFPALGAPFEGHFFYDLVHFVAGQGGARGGAFPSSHVSVATVVLLVVWRRERRLALVLMPIVAGLVLATVYGRFHYVVDVVAGLALALAVFGTFVAIPTRARLSSRILPGRRKGGVMQRIGVVVLGLVFSILGSYSVLAQSGAQPFKLGTFERNNQVFLGVVLNDSRVIDLAQANAALERREATAQKIAMPGDMKELIARYETELRGRLSAIASEVAAASTAPSYVYAIGDLRVLPPVQPSLILNGGGNYREHEQGIAAQQQRAGAAAPQAPPSAESAPGIWEREPGDTRENPYLFLKSPTIVVGPYDPIRMPLDRDHIDFECEFNIVIGKTASHIPIDRAADYIFGYTIQIDVSDRGGRGDRKMGGSDWLVGKNHDTFAPLGPFVVPKEFLADPLNVRQTFTLNGEVMQDSNTNRMTHNIYELLSYASNILTLHPGDLISGGSPAGTNIERAEPRWMRAGDTAVCTLEGVGTQTHPVVAPQTESSR